MSRARICLSLSLTVLAVSMLPAGAAGDGGKLEAGSWQRSYVSPAHPKVIKLGYGGKDRLDHASVYFHDDRVAVTLWFHPQSSNTIDASARFNCASVQMGEPLRGRTRIDGKTHRHPRPPDAYTRIFKLKRMHCPKAKVVRHHFE